jgi:hypothetical protein
LAGRAAFVFANTTILGDVALDDRLTTTATEAFKHNPRLVCACSDEPKRFVPPHISGECGHSRSSTASNGCLSYVPKGVELDEE